jgi:Uncharacterized protein involved in propionate catabolism
MTDLEGFAAWAAAFDIADAPGDVVHRAGLQVASAFAGARAGTAVDWFDATATAAGPGADTGTSGAASVVGGGCADVYTATFANAAASTVHDYDDYLFMGHTGHSAVFASLAACERAGTDGAALLENVVVANELAGRLGAAVAVGPHNGQMWAFIHQTAAAAVAANIEGDADTIREAVGLALYNPDYPLEPGSWTVTRRRSPRRNRRRRDCVSVMPPSAVRPPHPTRSRRFSTPTRISLSRNCSAGSASRGSPGRCVTNPGPVVRTSSPRSPVWRR